MTIAGLVLAAGSATRFGSPKVLARLEGRPLLEHVLLTARSAGLGPIVVVVGEAAEATEAAVPWAGEVRVRNPDPGRGLASSLRLGLEAVAALEPPVEALILMLGDQPLTRRNVVAALLALPEDPARPIVMPRYAGGGGPHPVLIRRAAFGLVGEASGDRGLAPLLARRPDLVGELPVDGVNPDVDTPADLAMLIEAAWTRRVIDNRAQVDRFRERPDGPDFYGPVSALFRVDPDRTDDPHLDALRALVRPGETVLDIGCGAGRFALPLARVAGQVIGVDPSESMLGALHEDAAAHGIANIRAVAGRWPAALAGLAPDGAPVADVSFIAHVGYDAEPIGPFVAAMEGATGRLCAALLAQPAPASLADPFWPAVHREARAALPAADLLLEFLSARGRSPQVHWLERPPRGYAGRDELVRFLRHQLWVEPGGAKDRRLDAAIDELAVERDGRWYIRADAAGRVALINWAPRPA